MFPKNKFTTNLNKFQLNGVNFTLWKHLPSNLYLLKHLIKTLYKAVFTLSKSSINTIFVPLDNKYLASIKNYCCRFIEINYPFITYQFPPALSTVPALSSTSLPPPCSIFQIGIRVKLLLLRFHLLANHKHTIDLFDKFEFV